MFPSIPQLDSTTVTIIYAAGGVIVLVIVLRIIGGWRQRARLRGVQASLHRSRDELERRAAEARRLSGRIIATSSSGQILGFEIVRQIETVFSDGEPSSAQALERVKAAAASKGANAIIQLQVRQLPVGKWVASGDAVIARSVALPGEDAGAGPATPA